MRLSDEALAKLEIPGESACVRESIITRPPFAGRVVVHTGCALKQDTHHDAGPGRPENFSIAPRT
jgi:hypothetical protein